MNPKVWKRDPKASCDLCRRDPVMPMLYEDEKWWITYCKEHHQCPLVCLKEHRAEFTKMEIRWIQQWANAHYPGSSIRWLKQSILGHAHCHVELKKEK